MIEAMFFYDFFDIRVRIAGTSIFIFFFSFFLISKNQSNAHKFGHLSCGFIYEGEESRVV